LIGNCRALKGFYALGNTRLLVSAAHQNFKACEGAEIDAVTMSGGMLGWKEKKSSDFYLY
jgi:hypothetical protein